MSRHLVTSLPGAQPAMSQQSAGDAIAGLQDDFDLLEDWTARYQYLIDLGRQLPPLPEALHTPDYLLHGCQSQVWFAVLPHNDRLQVLAISDSAIVSGLIAVLQKVYSGRTAVEIMAVDTGFLNALGLDQHLSPTRRNGLAAMITALREIAAQQQVAA